MLCARSNGLSYFILPPSLQVKERRGSLGTSLEKLKKILTVVGIKLKEQFYTCLLPYLISLFFPLRSFESDRLFFWIAVSSRPGIFRFCPCWFMEGLTTFTSLSELRAVITVLTDASFVLVSLFCFSLHLDRNLYWSRYLKFAQNSRLFLKNFLCALHFWIRTRKIVRPKIILPRWVNTSSQPWIVRKK